MSADQSKFDFWSKHLADAKAFPGSKENYCKTHGLKLATYYQWKQRIQGLKKTPKPPSFVPAVVAERPRVVSAPQLPNAAWVAEVMAHFLKTMS